MRINGSHPVDRGPDRSTNEIDEEFAFHLEQTAREEHESGLSEAAAREEALRRFGDVARYHRECLSVLRKEFTMVRTIIIAALGVLLLIASLAFWSMLNEARRSREMAQAARMDAEEQRLSAMQEQQRAEAMNRFLIDLLSATDPANSTGQINLHEVLEAATIQLDSDGTISPEVEAKVRRAIEQARYEVGVGNSGFQVIPSPDGAATVGNIYVHSSLAGSLVLPLPVGRDISLRSLYEAEQPRRGVYTVTTLYRNVDGEHTAVTTLTATPDGLVLGDDAVLRPNDIVVVLSPPESAEKPKGD